MPVNKIDTISVKDVGNVSVDLDDMDAEDYEDEDYEDYDDEDYEDYDDKQLEDDDGAPEEKRLVAQVHARAVQAAHTMKNCVIS